MAISVAGISFDLSFDGSKMLTSINASCKKIKDQFDQSFSQAAKKSVRAIETGNKEIDGILSDTARTAKSKAAAIAWIYKKEGASSSEAFQKAWSLIERESADGSRQVKKHLKEIGDQSKKTSLGMGDDFSNSFASIKSGFSDCGSIIKKAGAALAGAFAVKKIVDFGKSCLDLGSDLTEVQNVVDVTFPNMSAQVDKFAQSALKASGLSETMAKQYTGTFGAMAKAFGFNEKQAYDMGTALTSLTADVASFYNLSQDEAYTKLKSVFTGETESLKDLGAVMTQTALDSYALANGYGKTTSQMTEAEKVSLRYAFVQQQLSAASGDFARTSGSWANQVRVLSLQIDSLKASIGQGLINLFTPIIQAVNTLLGKLVTLANAFKAFTELITGNKNSGSGGSGQIAAAGVAASDASTGLQDATNAANDTTSAVKKTGNAAQKAAKQMRSLMGFDKIQKLSDSSDTSSGNTGSGNASPSTGNSNSLGSAVDFGSLATGEDAVSKLDKKWQKAFQNMQKAVEPTTKALKNLYDNGLARLGNFSWKALRDFYNHFLTPVGKWTLGNGLPRFIDALNEGLMNVNFGKINKALANLWDSLAKFTVNVGDGLLWIWENILVPLGTWTANEVVPRFLDTLRLAIDAVDSVLTALKPLFQWFWDSVLQPLAQWTGGIFLTVWDCINEALKTFSDWCANNPETIQSIAVIIGSFFAAWKIADFVQQAAGFITTAFNIITSVKSVAGAFSLVKTGISAVTTALGGPLVIGIAAAIAAGILLYKNWDTIKGKATQLVSWIKDKFSTLNKWLNGVFSKDWTKSFGAFGEPLNAFFRNVSKIVDSVKKIFNGLVNFLTGVFTGNWKKAWQGIKEIFAGVWKGLSSILTAPLNAIIGGFNAIIGIINGLINKINSIQFRITIPSWIPGIGGRWWGFEGFNIPSVGTIPYLAQGGYVKPNTPQLAVIGDNRHQGEVVAPENKLKEMAMAAVQAAGSGVSRDELESIINRAVMRIIAALADMGFYLDSEQVGRAARAAQAAADRRFNAVEVG